MVAGRGLGDEFENGGILAGAFGRHEFGGVACTLFYRG